MSLRAQADLALQAIGANLGTPLTLDGQGLAVLDFGDEARCWLSVSEARDCITFRCPLVQVFGSARDRVAEVALRLNLSPGPIATGRIGLIPADSQFVYRADLREPPTPDRLAGFLRVAMECAIEARAQLQAAVRAATDGQTEDELSEFLSLDAMIRV